MGGVPINFAPISIQKPALVALKCSLGHPVNVPGTSGACIHRCRRYRCSVYRIHRAPSPFWGPERGRDVAVEAVNPAKGGVPESGGVLGGLLNQETLKGDLFGGLTAAVVAMPLALAFGVASGECLLHIINSRNTLQAITDDNLIDVVIAKM